MAADRLGSLMIQQTTRKVHAAGIRALAGGRSASAPHEAQVEHPAEDPGPFEAPRVMLTIRPERVDAVTPPGSRSVAAVKVLNRRVAST